jgi:5-methylcytosine-specific restriction endonuclease McrA
MGVLLLNATYEALRIISLKRAVVLVLQEKAEIIESTDEEIRSVDVSLPRPEVIRLRYYVKVPFKARVPLSNRAVLNRDRFRCAYRTQNPECMVRATTVDHVHPKAKGGQHDWDNVVACCKKCNSKKADKTLEQMHWELSFVPHAPTSRTWIVVASPERAEQWSEWLEVA